MRLDRSLVHPRKGRPMHREIAYFPRDFIYLFHTSMTFPFVLLRFAASENRYGSLIASESFEFSSN